MLAQLAPQFAHAGLALAGAAAVAVPVAIHLLTRLRRRPQAFGAMRFLFEVYRRHRTRLRLEQWLLLALRGLVLITLGLALAGPMLGGWAGVWGQSGGGGGGAFGGDASARLVCLVLDDVLSTQAVDPAGQQRFSRLRRQATRLLGGLSPADRVVLWRAARPAQAVTEEGGIVLSPAAARRAIQQLAPRHSRSDLAAALNDLAPRLRRGELAPGIPADRRFVIVLSDLSNGTLTSSGPAPAPAPGSAPGRSPAPGTGERSVTAPPPSARALPSLRDLAKVFVARPAEATPNTQIERLTLRRHMVIWPPDEPTVWLPVELRLRRFAVEAAGDAAAAPGSVELAVLAEPGAAPLAVARREVRWSPGQSEAALNVELPVGPAAGGLSSATPPAAGWRPSDKAALRWVVQARLPGDALPADGVRLAVVEVRRQLRVGLVDAPPTGGEARDGMSPRRWIGLALAPWSGGGAAAGDSAGATRGAVELVDVAPAGVTGEDLAALDAVMVLRPELLEDQAWSALATFAQRGGLVWLWPPEPRHPAGRDWGAMVRKHLKPAWEIGLDPQSPDAATDPAGWSLRAQGPAPQALRLLAADWPGLVGPLRVRRRLPVVSRDALDQVYLQTQDDKPLLLAAPLGQGHAVFCAVAAHPDWSNLPLKPVFVPLLHEMLRGLLGGAGQAAEAGAAVSGQQVMLSQDWQDAAALVLQSPGPGSSNGADVRVPLKEVEGGRGSAGPVDLPGWYEPAPTTGGRKLVVNVDADAGDTGAPDGQRLAQWLDGLGPWQWLDEQSPAKALSVAAARTNLGWSLLWVTLALLVVETALARRFSHATVERSAVGV